jgi:hypothetical protein
MQRKKSYHLASATTNKAKKTTHTAKVFMICMLKSLVRTKKNNEKRKHTMHKHYIK